MSDFGDQHLLYRGPGGEERRLIDEAKRLVSFLWGLAEMCAVNKNNEGYHRAWVAYVKANQRYQRRYSAYYHTQQEA